MLNYIVRRLLLMIPTLLGITVLVFSVMMMVPGGLAASLDLEGGMRPEEREAERQYLNRRFGLDKPAPAQYLRWLNNISPIGCTVKADGTLGAFGFKAPDLGESHFKHRSVISLVKEALPITLLLNLLTIPFLYGIAVSSGILAAKHRGKLLDQGIGTVLLGLWSMPVIWVGVMLVGFLANHDIVALFPASGLHDVRAGSMAFLPHGRAGGVDRGWLLDAVWHLVAPIICLTYAGFAFLSKLMRASVLVNLSSDFVRTALAKGASEKIVLYRHVLRNSLLPLITVAASLLPGLLGGSLIVENIFSINGMGTLMIDAIRQQDRDLVLSQTLVVGLVGLFSLLLADICYAIADPRVSYE